MAEEKGQGERAVDESVGSEAVSREQAAAGDDLPVVLAGDDDTSAEIARAAAEWTPEVPVVIADERTESRDEAETGLGESVAPAGRGSAGDVDAGEDADVPASVAGLVEDVVLEAIEEYDDISGDVPDGMALAAEVVEAPAEDALEALEETDPLGSAELADPLEADDYSHALDDADLADPLDVDRPVDPLEAAGLADPLSAGELADAALIDAMLDATAPADASGATFEADGGVECVSFGASDADDSGAAVDAADAVGAEGWAADEGVSGPGLDVDGPQGAGVEEIDFDSAVEAGERFDMAPADGADGVADLGLDGLDDLDLAAPALDGDTMTIKGSEGTSGEEQEDVPESPYDGDSATEEVEDALDGHESETEFVGAAAGCAASGRRARGWVWVAGGTVAAAIVAGVLFWPELNELLGDLGGSAGTTTALGVDAGGAATPVADPVAAGGATGPVVVVDGGSAGSGTDAGSPPPPPPNQTADPAVADYRLAWVNVTRLAVTGSAGGRGSER
jgi:hypothetical protein